jgi:ATP-dependent Clp protease ATP-binding subunit ClpC
MVEILGRKKKNNVLIIGEPGVGKTTMLNGLAKYILSKECTEFLKYKNLYMLDVNKLLSDTQYRGQLEEKLSSFFKDVQTYDDIIVCIDEFQVFAQHQACINALKTQLNNNDTQLIVCISMDDYHKYMMNDKSLNRRFQKVYIHPTDVDQTIEILNKTKWYYEQHHRVKYNQESIDICVEYAKKYITDRFLPDSALDILDEAGSMVKNLYVSKTPKIIWSLEKNLQVLNQNKYDYIKNKKYDKLLELKAQIDDITNRLKLQAEKWRNSLDENPFEVELINITDATLRIASMRTDRLELNIKSINEIIKDISGQIIGQETVLDDVAKMLRRSVFKKDEYKPVASFLFIGPSGVGKTKLAQLLSENIYGFDTLLRFDMSEYSEKFTISSLIGAPHGYVGATEGGRLTEGIRKNPYSIILFDEIEKAHGDIFNLLLQMLDAGRLTDSIGRTVDCSHCIVIMTSNLGHNINTVGFNNNGVKDWTKALKSFFKLELLNRIDCITAFNTLNSKSVKSLCDNEIEKIKTILLDFNVKIKITQKLYEELLKNSQSIEYGVRYLVKISEYMILDPILDNLELNMKKNIILDWDDVEKKTAVLYK